MIYFTIGLTDFIYIFIHSCLNMLSIDFKMFFFNLFFFQRKLSVSSTIGDTTLDQSQADADGVDKSEKKKKKKRKKDVDGDETTPTIEQEEPIIASVEDTEGGEKKEKKKKKKKDKDKEAMES